MVEVILTFMTATTFMLLGLRATLRLLGVPKGTFVSFFTQLAAEIVHDCLHALWTAVFSPPRRRIGKRQRSRTR